jgi:serine/threonine protein kinase/WD40 repeat protein
MMRILSTSHESCICSFARCPRTWVCRCSYLYTEATMSKAPLTPIQLDYESQPVTRVIYAQETGHPGFKIIKSEVATTPDTGLGTSGQGLSTPGTGLGAPGQDLGTPGQTPGTSAGPEQGKPSPLRTPGKRPPGPAGPVEGKPQGGQAYVEGKPQGGQAYELVREIARGGMGVVYEARHQELGRTVALKIMRGANFANFEEVGRFRAEAEAVARLDHPNIIPIYEVGELQGQPFFTMKLVEGGSLADRVGQDSLPPREVARLMVKIARAVQHAHERGVLHRDLKPANILVDAQGEPYLSDFGIAKFAGKESGLTNPGDLVGTPAYVSPEQAFSGENLTTASDVWSLGVMLYQMLSGRLPFAGGSEVQMMQRIMHEEAAPLTGAPTPSGRSFAPAATTQFVEATPNLAPRAKAQTSPATGISAPGATAEQRAAAAGSAAPAAGEQTAAAPTTTSCARIDRDLVTIVARCLEKEPGRRLPSAKFLADELERWLAGEPIRSRHITPAERVWKWMRRYPYRVAVIVALLACIVVGGVTSLILWGQAREANIHLNAVNDSLTDTNEALARALLVSTATRLASESSVQVHEDATLGVLLALASAETTLKGKVLPDSVSALLNTMQHLGGVDATASRGLTEGETGYRVATARAAYLRPSPDGRWLITIDYVPEGIAAALFDAGLPLREAPRRKWMLRPEKGNNVAFFNAAWTADSQRLLVVDHLRGELVEWDVLAGLSGLDAAQPGASGPATITADPPSRQLGVVSPPSVVRHSADFLRDAAGEPNAVLYLEAEGPDFFLRRRRLDRTAATPLGEPETVLGMGKKLCHIINGNPARKWILLTEPYLKVVPVLLQVPGGGGPILTRELPEEPIETDAVAYSADGQWLAFSRRDGRIRLYNLAAGDLDAVAASGRDIYRRSTSCDCVSFSPDGQWLAVSGQDSTVQLVSLRNPAAPVQTLRISGRTSFTNTFSPDSRWLAIGGDDRIVSAWAVSEIAQAAKPIEFCGLSAPITEVQFSPDGRVLTALASAGQCRRWEFNGNNAGALPLTSAPGDNGIRSTATSPDGRWVASAGYPAAFEATGKESPIRLFRMGEPMVEYRLPGHYYPTGVAFSPDGRWLASTGRDAVVRVWEFAALAAALEAGQPAPAALSLTGPKTRLNYNRRLAFHPKGRLYCTTGDGLLFEWDLAATDPAASFRAHILHSIQYLLTDVTVSPDGHWLAVGRHGNDGVANPGQTQFGNMILLFDVSNPDELVPRQELWTHFRDQGKLAISPDSRWLAAGAHDGSAQVWDLREAKIAASVRSAPISAVDTTGIAFSPVGSVDGPWLAIGDSNGLVHLWDWQHGRATLRRIELADAVQAASFLPDGRLITGSRDGRLRLWETDPNRLIDLARRTAGRKLSDKEKSRFLDKR